MHANLSGAVAVLALTAMLTATAGGARAQDERVLTVGQTSIQALQAPVGASTANPLRVVAWVDHQDNTYAQDEQVRLFVQTNKDAYFDGAQRGTGRGDDGAVPEPLPVGQPRTGEREDGGAGPGVGRADRVSGTSGAELIKVIASSRPVPLFQAAQLAQGARSRRCASGPTRRRGTCRW